MTNSDPSLSAPPVRLHTSTSVTSCMAPSAFVLTRCFMAQPFCRVQHEEQGRCLFFMSIHGPRCCLCSRLPYLRWLLHTGLHQLESMAEVMMLVFAASLLAELEKWMSSASTAMVNMASYADSDAFVGPVSVVEEVHKRLTTDEVHSRIASCRGCQPGRGPVLGCK